MQHPNLLNRQLSTAAAFLAAAVTMCGMLIVGGTFKKATGLLPFCHSVKAEQAACAGSFADIWPDLAWVIAYAAVAVIFSTVLFLRQMKRQ